MKQFLARVARGENWVVYLLECSDGTYYCGATNDLGRRIGCHERGLVKYTRGRLPVSLAAVSLMMNKSCALRGEALVKTLPKHLKVNAVYQLIDGKL